MAVRSATREAVIEAARTRSRDCDDRASCTPMSDPVPFACDMAAIPAEQRGAHHALSRRLTRDAALEIREVPDGLRFIFGAEAYDDVVQFVAHERLCCPFLRFSVDVSSQRGTVALTLSGPPGAAVFIRAELDLPDR